MIEIYRDKKGEFRFRVKARNNKIVAISEGYVNKRNCLNGINSLINNVAGKKIVDTTKGK